jgi:hypothetical protein
MPLSRSVWRRGTLAFVGLLVSTAPRLVAQSDSVKAAIEITAIQYITKQVGISKGVTIDPAYARATDAPGKPTATRRSAARSDTIAHAVNGTTSSAGTAHGIHVILSTPIVRRDTATITVTGTYAVVSTPPMRGMQTYALTMVLDHGTWAIRKAVPLGK